jgi:TonB-linked SusC/RagA family outer membrane protein
MKLTIVLFFVSLAQMMATETYAQLTKLTLQVKDATVKEVLNQIEDNSDFFFLYNSKLIDVDRKVSIAAEDKNIDVILKNVFDQTNVVYTVIDKQIVLTNKADLMNADVAENQQTRTVTGKVTDDTGSPMTGVTVLIKGTTVGTLSDMNGNYTLNIPNQQNLILVFSFIGFKTQEVIVEGKSVIDLTLEAELTGLDEVIVIGYGTAKRSDLVGSTAPVSIKAIKRVPSGRVDQVLQGTSPGMMVQNTTAAPNGSYSIRIRGNNSLTGSNDPLVVIDGFLGGTLSSINPNDIASVEILKDASATAIYGSRGANGVIMVTTKQGAKGRTVVNYNGFVSFQQITKKMDLLNAADYAETTNANRAELGVAKPFTDQQIADFRANGGGTDWQDEIYRTAVQQNHQINVSGGNDNLSGYLSGDYVNNEGVMKGSAFEKYTVRGNILSSLGKKFKMGLNLSVSKSKDDPIITGGYQGSANQDVSPSNVALIFAPTQDVYNADGSYTQPSPYYGSPALLNPLALAVEPIDDNLEDIIGLTSFLEYQIIEGLTAKVLFGVDSRYRENSYYYNSVPSNGKGQEQAGIRNSRLLILQATGQLNYSKTIAANHQLDATLVAEKQGETVNASFAGTKGFSSDILTYNNLALGETPEIPTSSNTQKVIISFLGRVNYAYKQKYLLSLAGRYDGASVFGANEKWGFFPSGALAWRLDKEDFIKDISQIDNLKLRLSYGVTGSQAVPPYRSLDQLSSNFAYPVDGSNLSSGVGLGILGNPDLKWEKTGQFNVGIDLGVLKNRMRLTADYYNKRTQDLLLNVPIPRASGFTSILKNLGEVENKGFEFSLDGDPVVGDFTWNTNFNFSTNKNKVLSLGGQDNVPIGTTGFPNFGNTIFLVVGQPIGVLKGYIQDGTWGSEEAADAAIYKTVPGAPKYVDQNNDQKISGDDIAIMASTLPDYIFGWTNNLSYKNFDFSLFLQGVAKKTNYNLSRVRSERSSSDGDATDSRILNRWTPENQNTDVPTFTGSNKYEQLQSSRWIENGAYMRIKVISLGYSLTEPVLAKMGISAARIYLSGVNLFTFTEYTGYDPESSTAGVDALGGVDYGGYPAQRSYTIGLNLTF